MFWSSDIQKGSVLFCSCKVTRRKLATRLRTRGEGLGLLAKGAMINIEVIV